MVLYSSKAFFSSLVLSPDGFTESSHIPFSLYFTQVKKLYFSSLLNKDHGNREPTFLWLPVSTLPIILVAAESCRKENSPNQGEYHIAFGQDFQAHQEIQRWV